MTKFCKDCRYFDAGPHKCQHPIRDEQVLSFVSPIVGPMYERKYYRYAFDARCCSYDPCGPDGNQFEQKVTLIGTIKAILSGFKMNSKREGV